MALLLPRAVMIHVPHTGGTWCHRVFYEQGMLRGVLHSAANYPHPYPSDVRAAIGERPMFAVVRRPVAWLRSYWASAALAGGKGVERLRFPPSPWHRIAKCEAPDFTTFIERYLDTCPGEVSRLYARYTEGIEHIGRQESLLDDLARLLGAVKEPFDADKAATVPAENVASAKVDPQLAALSDELASAVRHAEADCLGTYYPWVTL